MIIRPATGADRSGVVALWETVFPDDPPHNAPSKVFAAKLAVADDMLLVAVDENAVVGTTMAGYDGHRGWLHKVAVLPQYQRRGVATALVRHAILAMRRQDTMRTARQSSNSSCDLKRPGSAIIRG